MERYESIRDKKALVLEDVESILKGIAESLERKESLLNMLHMDWVKEAVNFIKGYLSLNDISDIDISDYGIRYSYSEAGAMYDYDLFFIGLDNKGEVVVKTYNNNMYFRFSELNEALRFEIINSIIREVYGK